MPERATHVAVRVVPNETLKHSGDYLRVGVGTREVGIEFGAGASLPRTDESVMTKPESKPTALIINAPSQEPELLLIEAPLP
jgi:hypothetical protein